MFNPKSGPFIDLGEPLQGGGDRAMATMNENLFAKRTA